MDNMNMQATTGSTVAENLENVPYVQQHQQADLNSTTSYPWAGAGWRSADGSTDETGPAMTLIAPQILQRNGTGNKTQPHMLQPIAAATLSPLYPSPAGYTKANYEEASEEESEDDSDNQGGPNQVKFVNSTVEILQNQIRKEEAPKKKRTRTTPDQLRILQKAFNSDPMPNSSSRLVLAKRLGMNARAVQVWFQNRRAKEKLEAKRAESTPSSSQSNSQSRSHRTSLPNGNHSEITGRERAASHPVDFNQHTLPPLKDPAYGYDLGMYFGEVSLAQYANGFDLAGYNDTASVYNGGNNGNVVFDDFVSTGGLASLPNGIETADFSHMNNYTLALDQQQYDVEANNNLGIIFDAGTLEQVDCSHSQVSPSIHPSCYPPHALEYYYSPRHNSIDVLGMMGEAAVASLEERIYSRPASREAFITMPLGHSIPMPTKPRSLSVPDLSAVSKCPGSELMSIREEEMFPSGVCSPLASRRTSIAGGADLNRQASPPSCMILQGASGGGGMDDDLQTYLNEISAAI